MPDDPKKPAESKGLIERLADKIVDNPVSQKARDLWFGEKGARPVYRDVQTPPVKFSHRGGPLSGLIPEKGKPAKDINLPVESLRTADSRKK